MTIVLSLVVRIILQMFFQDVMNEKFKKMARFFLSIQKDFVKMENLCCIDIQIKIVPTLLRFRYLFPIVVKQFLEKIIHILKKLVKK